MKKSSQCVMSGRTKIGLLMVTWLTAVLRLRGLFTNTFHADEALFATWARYIAVWRDPLLLTQAVDKPPLLFYLQALFYPLQGPVEWAARLPNWIASVLLVPLVGVLVWHLWRDEATAVFAALLVALSPLHIQFSATAFTDPMLLFWGMGALWYQVSGVRHQVAGGRVQLTNRQCHLLSGLCLGLAVATKHQGWLFVPLVSGTAVLLGADRRAWGQMAAGFGGVLLLLTGWSVARNGRLFLIDQQVQNIGGFRLVNPWELWPRLRAWGALADTIWPLAWVILLGGVLFLLSRDLWRPRPSVQTRLLSWWGTWLVGYWLLHWLIAVPVWDRYALLLVPLTAVLLSYLFAKIRVANLKWGWLAALVVGALLLPDALAARNGRFPVGGQPMADSGAAQVAALLADEPYGTVLYDHWYSWQWRYQLFDKRVHVSWFPHAEALVEELIVFGQDGPRYLALPNDPVAAPILRAVTAAGFELQPVPQTAVSGIILYRVQPDPESD